MNRLSLGVCCLVFALLAACQPGVDTPAETAVAAGPPAGVLLALAPPVRLDAFDASPALDEIRELNAARRADLTGQPGWLHIQTRVTRGQADPFSAVGPGLESFDQEDWLRLDAVERVQQAVQRISVGGGPALEVRVLRDGNWQDLTRRSQSAGAGRAAFDPDYGFYELAGQLSAQGFALNKSLLYKECWYQGEKYTISDGHLQHEAVYNTGYRQLRRLNTWQIDSLGKITLVEGREILLEERVAEPPADVLALTQQMEVNP